MSLREVKGWQTTEAQTSQRLNQIIPEPMCKVIAVVCVAHKSVASCMQPWCSTPYLHYAISSIQLSPHSPFYHHCFPSLRCRREEDLSRTPNDLPSERCTYQNIIINATATAMHDKDPFQSYAPTMRGHQYSDQQEPPPLRLSSTSYIVLRLHLHRLHHLIYGAPIHSTQNIL